MLTPWPGREESREGCLQEGALDSASRNPSPLAGSQLVPEQAVVAKEVMTVTAAISKLQLSARHPFNPPGILRKQDLCSRPFQSCGEGKEDGNL